MACDVIGEVERLHPDVSTALNSKLNRTGRTLPAFLPAWMPQVVGHFFSKVRMPWYAADWGERRFTYDYRGDNGVIDRRSCYLGCRRVLVMVVFGA